MRPTRTGPGGAPSASSPARGAAGWPAAWPAPPRPASTPTLSGVVAIVPPHHVVQRVALHRHAAGGADHAHQLTLAELLPRVDAGRVADLLLDHGAVEIVDAERQRDLSELEAHVDPEGLDVTEVVEDESSDGKHLEVVEAGRPGQLTQTCVGRLQRLHPCLLYTSD